MVWLVGNSSRVCVCAFDTVRLRYTRLGFWTSMSCHDRMAANRGKISDLKPDQLDAFSSMKMFL